MLRASGSRTSFRARYPEGKHQHRREGLCMSSALYNRMVEVEFPAEARIVHDVRQKFEEFIQPCRFDREDVETMKVALSEACSNAVCHGSPHGSGDRIHVRYEVNAER